MALPHRLIPKYRQHHRLIVSVPSRCDYRGIVSGKSRIRNRTLSEKETHHGRRISSRRNQSKNQTTKGRQAVAARKRRTIPPKRIVRLGVSVATSGDVREHPKFADDEGLPNLEGGVASSLSSEITDPPAEPTGRSCRKPPLHRFFSDR